MFLIYFIHSVALGHGGGEQRAVITFIPHFTKGGCELEAGGGVGERGGRGWCFEMVMVGVHTTDQVRGVARKFHFRSQNLIPFIFSESVCEIIHLKILFIILLGKTVHRN